MQTMEQFSHDLTLALEETSRVGIGSTGRWGSRRRTCSTGNLPCAPQPTEDSSSSVTEFQNDIHSGQVYDGTVTNSLFSDSDDKHEARLSIKPREIVGNVESDSLNENFSPARILRPNTRRKRKFKRMAVEYETTPSTPGTTLEGIVPTVNPFPADSFIKKRVIKHNAQDHFRGNFPFFSGKRKRSHRDHRYNDHDHHKQHSSSLPRQRDIFPQRNSYQEYKMRTRSYSNASKSDRISPLNKNILTRIEKISSIQLPRTDRTSDMEAISTSKRRLDTISFAQSAACSGFKAFINPADLVDGNFPEICPLSLTGAASSSSIAEPLLLNQTNVATATTSAKMSLLSETVSSSSVCFNRAAVKIETGTLRPSLILGDKAFIAIKRKEKDPILKNHHHHHRKKNKHHRRQQMCSGLQFADPNSMECGYLNDFLSSSSLSSSDSEAGETNESDREGDDELTDWPGNEVIVNFASKNDFQRKFAKKLNIRGDDFGGTADDSTLMSADEAPVHPTNHHQVKPSPSFPIPISTIDSSEFAQHFRLPLRKVAKDGLSAETSSPLLSSSPFQTIEIREIRAGCRRIREERAGFRIMTSLNERFAQFLQDAGQFQLKLSNVECHEFDNLKHLAKLYSLHMSTENNFTILRKTSNTTQSVKIDKQNLGIGLLSDYKRRCYDNFDDLTSDAADTEIETSRAADLTLAASAGQNIDKASGVECNQNSFFRTETL